MYLLDTNICIFLIKKKNPLLLETIRKKQTKGLYISSLTIAELEFGIQKSQLKEKNKIALIGLLSIFTIIDFDNNDAAAYGTIRAALEKSGTIIGNIDMLLAAQAIARNLIFVTNNSKEFKRVPDLKIEDWSK
jgi:tRNA(fMet)-specific endonuclease VapC